MHLSDHIPIVKHHMSVMGSVIQEGVVIVNICSANIEALKYIKQILTHLKGEIGNNTIILGSFNTPLATMNRYCRQKINKETLNLNYRLNYMNLMDIYRTLHPTAAEHTFFSNAHRTFSRIDHMLSHKTSINKFKGVP